MKKTELQKIINECIAEVLAEDKKTLAINEIKRIITENELAGEELKEIFGLSAKEKAAKEAAKQRVSKQYDELAPKTKNPISKEDALKKAEKEDGYNGDFEIIKGILTYNSKSKNPIQGKTGGSSGFGTANK